MRWKCCMLNATVLIALALCQTELNLDPVVINRTDSTCTTDDGGEGVCVKYFLCDQDTKTVIDDGYTLIDVRAGECNEFLKVCCALNRLRDQSKEPSDDMSPSDKEVVEEKQVLEDTVLSNVPVVEKQVPDETVLSNVPVAEKQRPAMTVPSKVPRIEIGTCGYSNPGAALFRERDGGDPDDRVYADYGEFPWMVAILNGTTGGQWDSMKYIGGGSLIHPSVVITTAHKITIGYKLRDLTVRAGEYETNSEDEEFDAQERKVVKMLVHDNYDQAHVHNDVALLFLNRPVEQLNEPHVGIGCLAPVPPQPGTTCFSMGWGINDFGNKRVFAAILKKVKVPTLSANQCEQMLRRTRLGRKFNLHQSLLCAGGEKGIDTCTGDGGSSLVCRVESRGTRFAIYGMVAYGVGCGRQDVPGVYVNISNVYDWVKQQMVAEGLDTKSLVYM